MDAAAEFVRQHMRCFSDSSRCIHKLSKRDDGGGGVNIKVLIPVVILLVLAAGLLFGFLFRRKGQQGRNNDIEDPTKMDPANDTHVELGPYVVNQGKTGDSKNFVPDYGMSLDRSGVAGFDRIGANGQRDILGKAAPAPWDPTAPDGKLSNEEAELASPPPAYGRK